MTNAEAIAFASSQEADIAARIAAGEIPPRPEGHEAWREWYAKHIRCVEPTHAYFIRVRGGDRCETCVRAGHHSGVRYEVVAFEPIEMPSFMHLETATHEELDARATLPSVTHHRVAALPATITPQPGTNVITVGMVQATQPAPAQSTKRTPRRL